MFELEPEDFKDFPKIPRREAPEDLTFEGMEMRKDNADEVFAQLQAMPEPEEPYLQDYRRQTLREAEAARNLINNGGLGSDGLRIYRLPPDTPLLEGVRVYVNGMRKAYENGDRIGDRD